MDSRIKIIFLGSGSLDKSAVSILVLMDSRIKIAANSLGLVLPPSFNPCFNG